MRRVGPRRAQAASSASAGTRRSTRSPRASARSPSSADGPQAIVPYSATRARWDSCSTGRWTAASSTRLGASQLDRTICATAGKAGWAATIGASMGTDVERFDESRLILIWGSNPIVSNLHFWTRAQEAKRRGAKLIAIDPYRSQTAEKCHQHIALIPGTDAALALGLMHVLIAEDLARSRLHRPLHARLRRAARRAPPSIRRERVADICGIAGETVTRARARLRDDEAGGDPRQLRDAAPRGRRQRGARDRLPAGADRRRGAIPRAARCCRRRAPIPVDFARARAARPDPRHAAHDQHERDRRCAARRERPADPRDLRLQLEPGRRRARVVEGARPVSRATTSSASCTRSSRPTPPTTPTSCCRRPRSSSSSTSTARTAICTRSRTTRRSRRSAKRSRTPRCFGCSRRAMGFTEPCFQRQRRRPRARRRSSRTTRARRASIGRR